MAEVTRVPLQPVKKGTLPKIWLGVIVVIAAAILLAFVTVPAGVKLTEITPGTGASPTLEDVVMVNYTGKLAADNSVFDEGQAVPLPLEGMIPGFTEGVLKMKKGGKYTLSIPSEKGYGAEEKSNPMTGEVVIPANSDLVFEIELIDFMSAADFQQRMMMQQQMMQQMQDLQAGAEGE